MEMKKIIKVAVIVVIVAGGLGVLGVGVFAPRYQALSELGKQRDRWSESNTVMEADIHDLQDMQTKFETDRIYVEMTARKENFMQPREIVFIFPKE